MQRIAVARALAAGAKILLLDEPLGQLDAKVRNEIRYEIRRMAKDLKLNRHTRHPRPSRSHVYLRPHRSHEKRQNRPDRLP